MKFELKWIPPLFLLFCLIGCASLKAAKSDYERCSSDPTCSAAIIRAHDATYQAVKSAPLPFGEPTVVEAIAVIASNLAAFFVGVRRGRKLKG